MPARLSVIITMFNSAPTIAETIASLRAQTFTDWDCIVVNDGSTDTGPAIVESLIAQDPRIRMVTQENRGLSGARNRGIDECRTELVHFLDSDDWMSPRGLEWLVSAAAETGASYGGYELCDQTGRSLGRQSPVSCPIVGLDEQLEWNRTATHAHLFSRDAIGDCRFDEQLKVVEDYDMWLRLAARGERWKGVERIVAGYRLRPNSMSKQFGPMCSCYEMVVRKAIAECKLLGWEGKVDLSQKRFDRVVGNMALTYATMEALVDPSIGKCRAARLYDSASKPAKITTHLAANTASVALLFGACTAPDINGWSERKWLTPLRQWWVRCAEEGWMSYDQIDLAFWDLARKVVHPDQIADSMLDAATGHGAARVVVAGMDKNGRRLVRRAAARGLPVVAIDDFSDQRELDLFDHEDRARFAERVQVVRDAAALPTGQSPTGRETAWLLAPMDADGIHGAERLLDACGRDRSNVQRWADHREKIGAGNHERICQSLNTRPAKTG